MNNINIFLRITYTWIKYLVATVYVFKLASNVANIIMIIALHYDANKTSLECFA